MNELFNTVLSNVSSELTVMTSVITMLIALLFGGAIAFTYYKTQDDALYQRSLAVTLFILPIILSVIILFVGSNIARAFSLAGTLSIIRFRSTPGDAKDIGYIFFDIAAGLACGVGLYAYGALFVLILCAAIFFIERKGIFKPKAIRKQLKITIPEDLNCTGAFDDILNKYTQKFTLSRIKTTDLGSLFELIYVITISDGTNEQELINELRTRNGNLTIMISELAQSIK